MCIEIKTCTNMIASVIPHFHVEISCQEMTFEFFMVAELCGEAQGLLLD